MHKKIFLFIFFSLFAYCVSIFAQNNNDEATKLKQSIEQASEQSTEAITKPFDNMETLKEDLLRKTAPAQVPETTTPTTPATPTVIPQQDPQTNATDENGQKTETPPVKKPRYY